MRSIFVFGANRAGRHGKGSALHAKLNHGAIYGQGEGLQGDSYGIPTKDAIANVPLKDAKFRILPLPEIAEHVNTFLAFATAHPELEFNVTAIGCGLASYKPEQIAPMFRDAPANCLLPEEFKRVLMAAAAAHPKRILR